MMGGSSGFFGDPGGGAALNEFLGFAEGRSSNAATGVFLDCLHENNAQENVP
jgi:hypothetical protein